MTWPNFITLARLFSVPLIVWLILTGDYHLAFCLTLIAGISDILDGLLARILKVYSAIGARLDPFADKVLLMGIYTALSMKELVPLWLVILVIFRDILILGGIILLWGMKKNFKIQPLLISKANTFFQIITAASALIEGAYHPLSPSILFVLFYLTGLTTLISALGYTAVLSHILNQDAQ